MKKVFISLASVAALSLGSCSGWTSTEPLDYSRTTPAEADPAAYRSYLAALREYKESKHPVTMVTVKGVDVPVRQNQHLTSLPDSVDYIMIKGITELGSVITGEMQKVRDDKGTKVFCIVDYTSIVESWGALWQGTPENPDAEDNRTPEEFAAYCASQTEAQLSQFDRYGFDGLEISYLGKMSEAGEKEFISAVAAWRNSHANVPMIFRGYFGNISDPTILTDCSYLVVPANSAETTARMDEFVQRHLSYITIDEIKKQVRDRIIYEVAIPDIDDPQRVGVTPQVAAAWAVTPLAAGTPERNLFTKQGVAIDNAQDDYYNVDLIYKNIRQAVGIMNPHPEE